MPEDERGRYKSRSANEHDKDGRKEKDTKREKRVSRKLTKKRPESSSKSRTRSLARMTESGMVIPERFRHDDDEREDVTAMVEPMGRSGRGDMGIQYGNRSVFSLITTAGSNINSNFSTAFGGVESDDEDDEGEETETEQPGIRRTSKDERIDTNKASDSLAATKSRRESKKDSRPPISAEKHHKKLSERNFFKAIPRLHVRSSSSSTKTSPALSREDTREVSSQLQSPIDSPTSPTSPQEDERAMSSSIILRARDPKRNAPMMSQMLEAEAHMSTRPSFDMPRPPRQSSIVKSEMGDKDDMLSNSLAMRLMEIFHFEEAEEVLQEYPCWLLKSVLLQGYMYITQKHICFYAYLPKKTNEVVKSGYLAKRGKQNPKYNRYWFKLSGDVLSYYSDPADLYFPQGTVNLSYGISAEVADKEKGKDATHFTVVTHQRKYYFKADSIPSAKEWVKTLQKIIFRSRNEGDSVKISLPVGNVIDIEDAPVVEFAETCKIRVIDNDETYAIDEYFFSFFSFGKEAFEVLQNLVEDTAAQQIPPDLLNFSANQDGSDSPRESTSKTSSIHIARERSVALPLRASTPILEDSVRATLSPMLSPVGNDTSHRISGEYARSSFDGLRRSTDFGRARRSVEINRMGRDPRSASAGRRSISLNRLAEGETSEQQGSSASYVHSLEDPGSSAAVASDETQASASQILRGSDVFTSPTIQRSPSKLRKSKARDHFLSQSPERLETEHPHHAMTTGSLEGSNAGQVEPSSAPTLSSLMKAGSYPLQRAAGLAGYLTKGSKRMSSLLASESMGYVEKVSGMWKGGKRHYDAPQGGPIADGESDDEYEGDAEQVANANHRFHAHFALPEKEKLHAAYFGYLHRVLPLYGKIYISDRSFCFRSLLPGTRTKLVLPLKEIYTVDKEKGFRFGYSGLVIAIKGHEEIFFEFGHSDTRDDCVVTLLLHLEEVKYLKESGLLSLEEKERAEAAVAENKALQEARQRGQTGLKASSMADDAHNSPPILFDDPRASILNFKPTQSLRITCLTIGSRGDVQPYIALCKGLLAEGHKPKIATHLEFKSFVEDNGIAFEPIDGDPAELMRICVDNGMFTVSFLREAQSKFRGWIDGLLSSSWRACQNADILIESPSAMAGIHIAEALEIPYFRAFTMPWTRTRAYPHAFAVPNAKRGGAYNIMSYVMFDNVFWTFTSGQINRWRKKELGLPSTSLVKLEPNKVPFLYNFSPHVVVPPIDYSDWIRITGYWFFDESKSIPGWKPPPEIVAFIKKARADGKKIVYIGFGSITVPDAADLLKTCCESVQKADVRCILSKGWSDRLDSAHKDKYAPLLAAKNLPPDTPVTVSGEIVIVPEDVLIIKSCAHDWLFSQIDAAAHHGGAGTTGASLRAGLPTIIKPFFGDQFFFGRRVEELGVGICLKGINKRVLSRALFFATNEERMVSKAAELGEAIRKEDGVNTAIQSIYRDLEYAKSLIKRRNGKPLDSHHDDPEGAMFSEEESWTFIGDESGDPELVQRIKEWEGFSGGGEGRKGRMSGVSERGESFEDVSGKGKRRA